MNTYHILFRACDKIESVHKATRPFGLNKAQTIKLSFYSMYKELPAEQTHFTIIGDDLSEDLLQFFSAFPGVTIINEQLGSAAASLKKQISLAEQVPDDEWIYYCEDDYMHSPGWFIILDEFITNRESIVRTSRKKKNYMNFLIGDLALKPLFIHPPDYPDRYRPEQRRLSFLFISGHCHWRQITNTTHTFLTNGAGTRRYLKQIKKSAEGPSDSIISEQVYGRIWFKSRALCVSPIPGLSTHMTEGVMTPRVDWEGIHQDLIHELTERSLWQ
jgi:hypothetical protein